MKERKSHEFCVCSVCSMPLQPDTNPDRAVCGLVSKVNNQPEPQHLPAHFATEPLAWSIGSSDSMSRNSIAMGYNNRMSSQFQGTQHQGRGRKKEDENDALMRLVSSPLAKAPFVMLTRNSPIKRSQDVSTTSESPLHWPIWPSQTLSRSRWSSSGSRSCS